MRENGFHCKEVQDILSSSPSWFVRWGVYVIFFINIAFVATCCFIDYPETISGVAEIRRLSYGDEYIQDTTHIIEVVLNIPLEYGNSITTGQDVVLKLEAYPYTEYGFLEGQVEGLLNQIEYATTDPSTKSFCKVSVVLIKGLETNEGYTIPIESENLNADADIVIDRTKLVRYLYYRITR